MVCGWCWFIFYMNDILAQHGINKAIKTKKEIKCYAKYGKKENFMQNKQNIRKTRKKYLLNKGKQGINKNVSLEVVFTKYKYTVRTIFTTYRKQHYRILANINE